MKIGGVQVSDMKTGKASLTKPGKISPDPYSYEHKISLDGDAAKKIGMAQAPKVGDVFHVMGEGHITSVNQHEDGDGKGMHVGMQLKKLGVKARDAGDKKRGALGAINKGIKEADSE